MINTRKTKPKNMQNFFLILGLISAIFVAISAFGYNYYSNLDTKNSENNAQKERLDIHNEVSDGNKKVTNKLNNQDSILNDLKLGQTSIKNEVKSSIKKEKPSINIQNSPNSVVQVNENGNNIIDNSTSIYTSKQRVIDEQLGIQLLKKVDDELEKNNLGKNGKIVVTSPMMDEESKKFGISIVNFLIKNNYNVNNELNLYMANNNGSEIYDVMFYHGKENNRLEIWINTLRQ